MIYTYIHVCICMHAWVCVCASLLLLHMVMALLMVMAMDVLAVMVTLLYWYTVLSPLCQRETQCKTVAIHKSVEHLYNITRRYIECRHLSPFTSHGHLAPPALMSDARGGRIVTSSYVPFGVILKLCLYSSKAVLTRPLLLIFWELVHGMDDVSTNYIYTQRNMIHAGIILWLVASFLIGWAHAQNDPCICLHLSGGYYASDVINFAIFVALSKR